MAENDDAFYAQEIIIMNGDCDCEEESSDKFEGGDNDDNEHPKKDVVKFQ